MLRLPLKPSFPLAHEILVLCLASCLFLGLDGFVLVLRVRPAGARKKINKTGRIDDRGDARRKQGGGGVT